jgi:hypothetical protein
LGRRDTVLRVVIVDVGEQRGRRGGENGSYDMHFSGLFCLSSLDC